MRVVLAAVIGLAGCHHEDPPAPKKLEIIEAAPTKDVAADVAREYAAAERSHLRLLVYVGASWCEPCRHFHDAAVAGELDGVFGGIRLLAFDLDRDGDALQRAGYQSTLIPLFALPRPDGTATGKQIEGSIKGDGAVAQITPRLQALLR